MCQFPGHHPELSLMTTERKSTQEAVSFFGGLFSLPSTGLRASLQFPDSSPSPTASLHLLKTEKKKMLA